MRGGVYPRSPKSASAALSIATASVPARVFIPVQQHADSSCQSIVSAGDRVAFGQAIARPTDINGAWLHSPVSGAVAGIETGLTPDGRVSAVIAIDNDGRDSHDGQWHALSDAMSRSVDDLKHSVAQGGIAGLGGAAFPTAAKLHASGKHPIDTLIVNGAECEPFINCDDALMRAHADDVVLGTQLLLRAVRAPRALVAVESNKPEAIDALRDALNRAADSRLALCVVDAIYPIGGERQLIVSLTGREVPHNGLPADVGVHCQNVATAAAIARLVQTGEPLVKRIVTITGSAVREPRNLLVRIGTPISSLIADCGGYAMPPTQLIMGGPMMGIALASDAVPVVKGTNCIIAATPADLIARGPSLPCIRCGECAIACPAYLLPQEIYRQAVNGSRRGAQALGLKDCIECGCCDYVCPSQIPLTATFIAVKATRPLP